MSYTHNMNAEYRDVALSAREEVSEGHKEFFKLFGASVLTTLAAAACGGGGSSVSATPSTPSGEDNGLILNDYEGILGPNAKGWKYLSVFKDDYCHMNYGTVGSMPESVLQDMAEWHKDIAYSPAGPNSWTVTNAVIRAEGAVALYGCFPQEMACTFNTTDGMIKTITSIKWNAGDMILITNNEHAGGLGPIHMIANRYGCKLKEVNVPTGVSKGPGTGGYAEDGTLVDRFEVARKTAADAGVKVRAIMISSPPYTLGWRLEEKELCLWAASHGILSLVDGAHIPGSMPIDLHDMGCDYFAATAAKWQCAPAQTGYSYIRGGKKNDSTDWVHSTRSGTTTEWTNPNDIEPFYLNSSSSNIGYNPNWKAHSFDLGGAIAGVGNPNYPTLKMMYEINKVWDGIGRSKIAKYNQSLAQYLRQKCAQSDKMGLYSMGVDFQTPKGVVPTGLALETNFPRYLQTGLTAVNPFGPNKDFNDTLTASESASQLAASRAVLARLSSEYSISIRNISTKHQLRSAPGQSARAVNVNGSALPAGTANYSSPLRISTHLYTTVAEVDRCVDGLNNIL